MHTHFEDDEDMLDKGSQQVQVSQRTCHVTLHDKVLPSDGVEPAHTS